MRRGDVRVPYLAEIVLWGPVGPLENPQQLQPVRLAGGADESESVEPLGEEEDELRAGSALWAG